jgi:NAD-dependent SIR2 family protein deacetylase
MQFCDDGPDVPDDLISAQLAGDVVFVVGAGVSARAGLPLFGELVRKVYARLGQAAPQTPDSLADAAETDAWVRSEWDRTLGLLERRLVYPNPNRPETENAVREAVAEELRTPRRSSVAHRDILDISRDAARRPRMVTTNFDTLFERAQQSTGRNRVASSVGPGLAAVGSPDFNGVMHLHGRIANARLGVAASNLVLTSADFGEAYLRSGWASRFVYDLLRRYTLVFVGYAADDPPMRYMLEATEAGRLHFPDLRRAYAFAPFGENPTSDEGSVRARWRAKGLVPILYENHDRSHDSLYQSLSAWADCARDPGAWAAGEIPRIAGGSFEDASERTRAKVKYLTTTMANTAVLSNCAGSPDWIECLIDRSSAPYLLERDASVWLAQKLANRAAATWALATPPTIKAIVARAAQSHLVASRAPLSDVMYRFWRLYVTAFGRGNGSVVFDRLALRAGLRAATPDYFTIEGVVEVVRPRLQLAAPLPSFGLLGDREGPTEPRHW